MFIESMHSVNEMTAGIETAAIFGLGTVSTLAFVIRVAVIEVIGMIAEIKKANQERKGN